jgi:hypothetical protein
MRGFFSEPKKLTDADIDKIIDSNPRFGSFKDDFDPEEDDALIRRDTKINPNVYGKMTPQEKKIWGDRVMAMSQQDMEVFLSKVPTELIIEELSMRFERLESTNRRMYDILKEE